MPPMTNNLTIFGELASVFQKEKWLMEGRTPFLVKKAIQVQTKMELVRTAVKAFTMIIYKTGI